MEENLPDVSGPLSPKPDHRFTKGALSLFARLKGVSLPRIENEGQNNTSYPESMTQLSCNEGQRATDIPLEPREPENREQVPFPGSIQIPGCNPSIFVFPNNHAAIGSSFLERFPEVVNIFRHNAKEHPRLKNNLQYIDYSLHMCGASQSDTHPSILVFCRHSDFKDLHSLLTSKELKYQYCLRRSTRNRLFSRSQLPEEHHKPYFNLYFWRESIPRTLYLGICGHVSMSILSLPLRTDWRSEQKSHQLTMCGTVVNLIGDEPKSSTLGCVLKIDGTVYGITTRHMFPQDQSTIPIEEKPVPQSEPNEGQISELEKRCTMEDLTPTTDEGILRDSSSDISNVTESDEDFFIDDIEYDSLTEAELTGIDDSGNNIKADDGLDNNSNDNNPEGVSFRSDSFQHGPEATEIVYSPDQGQDEFEEGDLDWALVKLTYRGHWRPNAYFDPRDPYPWLLSKIAKYNPGRNTRVLIITSKMLPQEGFIRSGVSILGGINGKAPSEMWTVVLDRGSSKCTSWHCSRYFRFEAHIYSRADSG